MSGDNSDRFKNIERGRAGPLTESVSTEAAERFGVMESENVVAKVDEGNPIDRFRESDDVQLDANRDEEQPFVKCARCGTEAGKFAQRCLVCGAGFDSSEQREFNAQIWRERKAAIDAEKQHDAQHQQLLLDDARQHVGQQRALGEAIAREVRSEYSAQAVGAESISVPIPEDLDWLLRPPILLLGSRLGFGFGIAAVTAFVGVMLLLAAECERRSGGWFLGVAGLVAFGFSWVPPRYWFVVK